MKICQRCNLEYQEKRIDQKFCPDCKHEADLERNRSNSKKFHANGPGSGGNQWGRNNHQYKRPDGMISKREYLDSLNGDYKCQRCGTNLQEYIEHPGSYMHAIHHKDWDSENDLPENYELLCKRCHQIEHECWENYNAKG